MSGSPAESFPFDPPLLTSLGSVQTPIEASSLLLSSLLVLLLQLLLVVVVSEGWSVLW